MWIINRYYLLLPPSLWILYISFFGCLIQFYTFQNFLRIINFYNIKILPPTHYFHLLFQIYQLNMHGSYHFTNFSFYLSILYTILYTFLSLCVHSKHIHPKGTEGVVFICCFHPPNLRIHATYFSIRLPILLKTFTLLMIGLDRIG